MLLSTVLGVGKCQHKKGHSKSHNTAASEETIDFQLKILFMCDTFDCPLAQLDGMSNTSTGNSEVAMLDWPTA